MSIKLPFLSNYYSCIVADPGWNSEEKGCRGFKGVKGYQVHPTYTTMNLVDIYGMDSEIKRISAPKCHLWLWTTELFLPDAEKIAEHWGFELKRRYIWIKTTDGLSKNLKGLECFTRDEIAIANRVLQAAGISGFAPMTGKPYSRTGYWGKVGVEYLLFCTNDRSFRNLNGASEYQTIFAPAPKDVPEVHSAKPDAAFEVIRRNSPGPRVSIFERLHRPGFRCFGNQL